MPTATVTLPAKRPTRYSKGRNVETARIVTRNESDTPGFYVYNEKNERVAFVPVKVEANPHHFAGNGFLSSFLHIWTGNKPRTEDVDGFMLKADVDNITGTGATVNFIRKNPRLGSANVRRLERYVTFVDAEGKRVSDSAIVHTAAPREVIKRSKIYRTG